MDEINLKLQKQFDIITVGNGSKKYPGDFTPKEKRIIYKYAKGKIINLFSGISKIGDLRIDFACKEATNNCNVFDFLENNNLSDFETVIIDAPYNQKFADKYQKIGNTPKQFVIFANTPDTTRLFELIRYKINPKIIIIKSWNYYIPWNYELLALFLCYPGGFRKSTILEILNKAKQIE